MLRNSGWNNVRVMHCQWINISIRIVIFGTYSAGKCFLLLLLGRLIIEKYAFNMLEIY